MKHIGLYCFTTLIYQGDTAFIWHFNVCMVKGNSGFHYLNGKQ